MDKECIISIFHILYMYSVAHWFFDLVMTARLIKMRESAAYASALII